MQHGKQFHKPNSVDEEILSPSVKDRIPATNEKAALAPLNAPGKSAVASDDPRLTPVGAGAGLMTPADKIRLDALLTVLADGGVIGGGGAVTTLNLKAGLAGVRVGNSIEITGIAGGGTVTSVGGASGLELASGNPAINPVLGVRVGDMLQVDGGGRLAFKNPGAGLQLLGASPAKVLSVLFGSLAGTACEGNDPRLSPDFPVDQVTGGPGVTTNPVSGLGNVVLGADFMAAGGDNGAGVKVARGDHKHDALYSGALHDHSGGGAGGGTVFPATFKPPVLGADPGGLAGGDEGRFWYNSVTDLVKYWDGAAALAIASREWVVDQGYLTAAVTSVATGLGLSGGPIVGVGTVSPDFSVLTRRDSSAHEASAVQRGLLTAVGFSKLADLVTLIKPDGSTVTSSAGGGFQKIQFLGAGGATIDIAESGGDATRANVTITAGGGGGGGGAVNSVGGGTGITLSGTAADPVVNLDPAYTAIGTGGVGARSGLFHKDDKRDWDALLGFKAIADAAGVDQVTSGSRQASLRFAAGAGIAVAFDDALKKVTVSSTQAGGTVTSVGAGDGLKTDLAGNAPIVGAGNLLVSFGAGLTLDASVPKKLIPDFSGSGALGKVARSDHDHAGVYSLVGHNHDGAYVTAVGAGDGLDLDAASTATFPVLKVVPGSGILVQADSVQVRLAADRALKFSGNPGGLDINYGVGLQVTGAGPGSLDVKYGAVAGTACPGNDARLSDDRIPLLGVKKDDVDLNPAVVNAKALNFKGFGAGVTYDAGSRVATIQLPASTTGTVNKVTRLDAAGNPVVPSILDMGEVKFKGAGVALSGSTGAGATVDITGVLDVEDSNVILGSVPGAKKIKFSPAGGVTVSAGGGGSALVTLNVTGITAVSHDGSLSGDGNAVPLKVVFAGLGGDFGALLSAARSDHLHDGRYPQLAAANTFLGSQHFGPQNPAATAYSGLHILVADSPYQDAGVPINVSTLSWGDRSPLNVSTPTWDLVGMIGSEGAQLDPTSGTKYDLFQFSRRAAGVSGGGSPSPDPRLRLLGEQRSGPANTQYQAGDLILGYNVLSGKKAYRVHKGGGKFPGIQWDGSKNAGVGGWTFSHDGDNYRDLLEPVAGAGLASVDGSAANLGKRTLSLNLASANVFSVNQQILRGAFASGWILENNFICGGVELENAGDANLRGILNVGINTNRAIPKKGGAGADVAGAWFRADTRSGDEGLSGFYRPTGSLPENKLFWLEKTGRLHVLEDVYVGSAAAGTKLVRPDQANAWGVAQNLFAGSQVSGSNILKVADFTAGLDAGVAVTPARSDHRHQRFIPAFAYTAYNFASAGGSVVIAAETHPTKLDITVLAGQENGPAVVRFFLPPDFPAGRGFTLRFLWSGNTTIGGASTSLAANDPAGPGNGVPMGLTTLDLGATSFVSRETFLFPPGPTPNFIAGAFTTYDVIVAPNAAYTAGKECRFAAYLGNNTGITYHAYLHETWVLY